jgi:PHD/YefM family antitoxin component YafN of YafNO toxin-antitoxin module
VSTEKGVDTVKIGSHYLVNEKGQKTAVVIPIEKYEELLEDLHDLAIVVERRDESSISFEELKERLRNDGLL